MKSRLVYLDNIKVFLISYVIMAHIASSYGGIGGGKWSYIEPAETMLTKISLTLFALFAYAFLMGMFIFIAGYFTYPSLKRKGTVSFLKDRMIRLAIPLLIYYFVIGPLVKYISSSAKGYNGTLFQFLSESYHSGVYGHIGVMWFVVLILFFSVVYAFFLQQFPNGWYKPKDDALPGHLQVFIFVVVVGLLSYLTRIIFPQGGDFMGSRPLGSLVFFGTSFFLGTTASRYQWLEKLSFNKALPWFIFALAVMVIPAILLIIFKQEINIGVVARRGSMASLLYAYWEVIKTLGTGMIAVVAFRKWLNKPGKLAETLGQSVFLAYFIHPLICMLYLYAFSKTEMHALLKFAIVAPTALVSTFFIACMLRRIPAVRKII
ncbi:MAG: acyltransferase family protein [Bacteroidota bacterium]